MRGTNKLQTSRSGHAEASQRFLCANVQNSEGFCCLVECKFEGSIRGMIVLVQGILQFIMTYILEHSQILAIFQ